MLGRKLRGRELDFVEYDARIIDEGAKEKKLKDMANKSTVTIDTRTAEILLKEIETMSKSLEILKKKIIRLLPARYGSDAWWEKEINEALKEVKEGRYTVYKNAKDLIRDLHAGA